MKYVDAGYVVALGTLFFYALSLAARRRRLERTAAAIRSGSPPTDASDAGAGGPEGGPS